MYKETFQYWQNRILIAMTVGYTGFYLVRNNFGLAKPLLSQDFGYTHCEIGWIVTVSAFIYGFGKGLCGILSDRSNARYFMPIGLLLSCLMNILIVFSGGSSLTWLIVIWGFNALFQSMGWPPCARLLTHWFTKKEIGFKWALWNTSQQIGMLSMYVLNIYAFTTLKDWRYIFILPAAASVLIALYIFARIRDTPESLGFKSIREEENVGNQTFTSFLIKQVYTNPLIWCISIANLFLYYVKTCFQFWAPTFLILLKNNSACVSICQLLIYETGSIAGGLMAGIISDKIFKGERGAVSTLYMLSITVLAIIYWWLPAHSVMFQFFVMFFIGFFITGPQILIGVAATDFAGKDAAGAASGLTGVFGYMGTAVAGYPAGKILDLYGWDVFFSVILFASVIASFLLYVSWKVRAKSKMQFS